MADEDVRQTHRQVVPLFIVIIIHLLLWAGTIGTLFFASVGREWDYNRLYIISSVTVMFMGLMIIIVTNYIDSNVWGLTCVFFLDSYDGATMGHISCNPSVVVGKTHFRFPISGWWWRKAVVVGYDGMIIKRLRLGRNWKRSVWTLSESDGCNAISHDNAYLLLAALVGCEQTLATLPFRFVAQKNEVARLEKEVEQNETETREALRNVEERRLVTEHHLDLLGTFCAEAVVVSGKKGQPVKKEFKIGTHAGSFAARLLTLVPETKVASWYAAAEENIKQRAGSELATTR